MPTFFVELRLAVALAFLAFIVYLVARHVRAQSDAIRAHLEGRNRLIDRFGNADAFLAFARSEEGRALLSPPQTTPAGRQLPGLRLIQSAMVCMALGAGFEIVGGSEGLGVLLLCGGGGLLLAGLLAWFTERTTEGNRR